METTVPFTGTLECRQKDYLVTRQQLKRHKTNLFYLIKHPYIMLEFKTNQYTEFVNTYDLTWISPKTILMDIGRCSKIYFELFYQPTQPNSYWKYTNNNVFGLSKISQKIIVTAVVWQNKSELITLNVHSYKRIYI